MQRAVLSVSHVFNCATLDGIAQAALPPPVVPDAKPSGLPTTAYVARSSNWERSPTTAALAVAIALPRARVEIFILMIVSGENRNADNGTKARYT